MRAIRPGRAILSFVVTAVMLCACGGASMSLEATGAAAYGRAPHGNATFQYTGGEQEFTVPAGVAKLSVVVRGAAGGGYSYKGSSGYHEYFGRGARAFALISVTPGERLYVFVGGQGHSPAGGFNGGGNGGAGRGLGDGNGGGGASDVREGGDALQDRIIVAAGGGGQGAGDRRDGFGGKGGAAIGGTGGSGYSSSDNASGDGGNGGTQSKGGLGGDGGKGTDRHNHGAHGSRGALGVGGIGGQAGGNHSGYGGGGGGGAGGGYYGGGGGGGGGGAFASLYGGFGGGGGGGSSHVDRQAKKSRMWPGWKNATGDGLVVFSWQ
jgi:hypothetical protein